MDQWIEVEDGKGCVDVERIGQVISLAVVASTTDDRRRRVLLCSHEAREIAALLLAHAEHAESAARGAKKMGEGS